MSAVLAPQSSVSPAEWALRVQLAAAYRIADLVGWSEMIYSHISVRIPGPEHHFLINPYGLRYDEVTASSLVKVTTEGETVGPHEYKAQKAGFIIHSAIHAARDDAQCVWHMHSLPGMAVSCQEDGLLPIHMYATNFYERLSYHEYEGPSMRLAERERITKSLNKNCALILRNHGLLTVGRTIPEAFIRFWRLNRACEVQLAAQGAKLRFPSKEVCEASREMTDEFLRHQASEGELEFAAQLRRIDRLDGSYKN